MATAAKKTSAAKTAHHAADTSTEEIDTTPALNEAREMFAENPGLAHVLTTEGRLSRDGILTPALTGE